MFCDKKLFKILYLWIFFCLENSTIDSWKTSITQEWLVLESCPIPRWIAFLVLCQLVYNLRSHFNKIILAWSAYFQKNLLWLISFPEILVLVLYLILTCFCKGYTSKLLKRTQETAIHLDHEKINIAKRGRYLDRIEIAAKNDMGTGSKQ